MNANIGTGEILVILIVALLLVGPEKLPKVAKAFGKAVAGFKRYMNDMTEEFKDVSSEFKDMTNNLSEMQKDVQKTLKSAMEDTEDTVQSLNEDLKGIGKDVSKSVDKAVGGDAKTAGKIGDETGEANVSGEDQGPADGLEEEPSDEETDHNFANQYVVEEL